VQSLDAFGNLVPADAATVTMRGAGSVVWSPASGPLVAGQFLTAGRDTVVESVSIGADRAGGGAGSGGTAVVSPGAPAGVIAMAATRDSLTADGRSASTVTLGPVRDAYGNLVGLNFDRVWEGTMSDINYDPSLCRNIMVDIRYVLLIIDKYAGMNRLIQEMKLVHPKKKAVTH